MSAATTVPDIDTHRPGISLVRLTGVEVRKAFDTRAGFWYSLSILILAAVVLVFAVSFVPDETLSLDFLIRGPGQVLGYFLPIIPILMVTSEWGQRTGLVTFTLEPRRSRVIVAKFVAGVLVAVAVAVIALGLTYLILWIGSMFRTVPLDWDLSGQTLGTIALSNIIGVFIGFALATLLRNTAAAIVGYFVYSLVLPIVVGVVGALVEWFGDLAPWIEFNTAQVPLLAGEHLSGQEWGQFATSGTIWLIVPLVLGTWVVLRSEVK